MNLSALKTIIQSFVLDNNNGIANTFYHEWPSIVNDIQNDYDLFLMVPPILTDSNPRKIDWRTYRMTFYLFSQNVNLGTQEKYTEAERDVAWSELIANMDKLIVYINDNPNMFQITSEVTMEMDSGGMGTDDLIWVKTVFSLKVENCS
jgi:hypothetical protein